MNAIRLSVFAACLCWAIAASADETSANAGDWGKFEVGVAAAHLEITGTAGERRPLDLLFWYPADRQSYRSGTPVVYTSRLNGIKLDPARWDPGSWSVAAERARQGVAVDQYGPAFPLIIVSHPAQSQPYNYGPLLERLASHGYVIAAPYHEGDTQEDRIIDLINQRAGSKIVTCFDGGPSPCQDGAQKAVQNRARDLAAILDSIGEYFGERVDTARVGLLGHSRGTITALAAAGGSIAWNIQPEPRISGIMMQAIGMPDITGAQDVHEIKIPALFVAGKIDRNTPMPISVAAFEEMPGTDKALVILERGEHGVYSSQRCAQMQAVGAIYQANPRALAEQLLLENILISANSGTALDYCTFDFFVNPVDIRPTVKAVTGFDVTPDNVPRSLDTVTAMRVILELANTFFDAVLVRHAQPGVHFKQYLAPAFLLEKEGQVVNYAESRSYQGREVACRDPDLRALDEACP